MNKPSPWVETCIYAVTLLCFSLVFPLWGFRVFDDEADNLATGRLVASGFVLYEDVFSHHFPFPYYFIAAVFHLVGASIPAMRIALALFIAAVFLTASVLTKERVIFYVTYVAWLFVGPLYLSNMLVYHSFVAPSMMLVFGLSCYLLRTRESAHDKKIGVVLGIASSISILSDPLTIYPIAFAVLVSLGVSRSRSAALWWIGSGILFAITWLGHLAITHSIDSFWQHAIRFNLEYYAAYRPSPDMLKAIVQVGQSALQLIDPQWWGSTLLPQDFFDRQHWDTLDSSILGGVGYRIVILISLLILLERKQLGAALYIFGFSLLLLASIHDRGIQGQSFILISLLVTAWLAVSTKGVRYLASVYLILLCCIGGIWLWDKRDLMSYEKNFSEIEKRAEYFDMLIPPTLPTTFGVYPADPYLFFLKPFHPIAGFTFMWPLVADYGAQKVIDVLRDRPAVIQLHTWAIFWGKSVLESLGSILHFCQQNCFELRRQVFLSHALVASKDFELRYEALSQERRIALQFPERYLGALFLTPTGEGIERGEDVRINHFAWPAFRATSKKAQNLKFFNRGMDTFYAALCSTKSLQVNVRTLAKSERRSEEVVLIPDATRDEQGCATIAIGLKGIDTVEIVPVNGTGAVSISEITVAGAHMSNDGSMFEHPFEYIRAMENGVSVN